MRATRLSPTLWFKVYVALAGAALCIACMSIWLGSTLLTAHRDSVHLYATWGARQNSLAELSGRAARAHRAISGGIDRAHREEALLALRQSLVDFELDAAECLEDLHGIADPALVALLVKGVGEAQAAMEEMAHQGEELFEAMEAGDLRNAGMRMSQFNAAYAEVQLALAPLRPAIRDSIGRTFRKQLGDSERMERTQYTVAGLMCIGVIGAVWYGRRLYEAMTTAEREHAEYVAAISQGRDAAEAAIRAKSEFLANMSHEIRTPMTAMLGCADLLAEPVQSESERDRCIRTIRRSGEHLLAILNDILDLSKIEAGRMTLECIECSPIQIVEEVCALVRARAQEQGVVLRIDHSFPLPRTINGDPLRLKQIILNLVGNAIKFTPRGSVSLGLELCGAEHDLLAVRIADTGIGMTEEHMEVLFQPFTQGDGSMTRRFGGSGLGLSISQRLAELMQAQIAVESRLGRGSTFTLMLQIGRVEANELVRSVDEAVLRPLPAPAELSRLSGRVLVAEDGLDNQRLIKTFLTRAGAEVELVDNGSAAVEQALHASPGFDLVLMDMQMPILDGYTAVRQLRERGYTGPVLALTAHAMPGERERCIAAGCDEYISKPMERRRFLEVCQLWMERGRGAAAA